MDESKQRGPNSTNALCFLTTTMNLLNRGRPAKAMLASRGYIDEMDGGLTSVRGVLIVRCPS